MTASPVRYGIVGTGMFANTHAEVITQAKGSIVGAVSRSAEKCAAFVATHGGQCFESVDAMLEHARPDVVTICTPNDTHTKIVEEILMHLKAPHLIIVEKPLCVSREELDRLATLPKELRDRIIVDHTRRFDPMCQKLQQIIQTGELGTLTSGHIRYRAAWMHKAVHMIDLLRMLLGEFTCKDATLVGIDRLENDPLITATLQSESTPEATVLCEGLYEKSGGMTGMELLFMAGRVRLESNDFFISRQAEAKEEQLKGGSAIESLRHLYGACAAFLQDGDRGMLDSAGFDEAAKTMNLMFAAREL